MAKSKKNRQQDFQKVKLKVGKKLKKADNVTNASFRTRGIQINQQLKTGDASQPSTKKKHNITDLFSQCRHYSTSVRVEAVNGLREIITSNPELVQSHLSNILERNAELLTDKESNVRQGAIRVFKIFLPLVSEKQISPFFPLLCAHLCCAMTHIFDDIQVDSLAVLDLLLDNYPRLIIYRSSQVLSNFIEQISRQKGQGQAKRSLSTNPNSATSSIKWRSSVLNRLQKFLSAILKFQEFTNDGTNISEGHDMLNEGDVIFTQEEVVSVDRFPVYIQEQWMAPGLSISSSLDKDGKSDILGGKFPDFAKTLIPLLLECWVESAPSKDRHKYSGENLVSGENTSMMYNILQVTQLLWQCMVKLSAEQSENIVSQDMYLKEFEQHFMVNFPYSVNTRISMKGKKQQAGEQVSAEILNLTVCDIMTNFISKKSTNQKQSHDPVWLPVVTKYLNDFLRAKYGRAGVGHSARTVVNILSRLIDRELYDGPVLGILSEVYNRFETANISSTEKKVYMQFFADILLNERSQLISQELRRKFLHGLPELLPLCTKENSVLASLVINTMKKGACQRCSHLLNTEIFNKVGQQWFDPQGDVITKLSIKDQKSLVGLLYYAEDIGLELIKTLVSFARCSSISDDLVTFMIQVLQNRYLRGEMRPDAASIHVGFLTNLLIGVSKSDIENLEADDRHPVIGKYKIVMDSVLDADNTEDFDRHCFIVGVVCSCVQQFYNTYQVVDVMFGFIEKMLEASSFCIPLQMAFGICKFVDSLKHIPPAVVSLYSNLCISLANHLITCQQSTNQNTVKLMLDLVCKLIMDIPYGLNRLLTAIDSRLNKDVDFDVMSTLVKTVMLFLTEGRDSCIRSRPECSQMISSINNRLQAYISQHKGQVTLESDQLIRKFTYLVSNLK